MASFQNFTCPEAYQKAVQDFDLSLMGCAPDSFRGALRFCAVGDVTLQMGRSEQGVMAHVRRSTDRICIGFMPSGGMPQIIDGTAVDSRHIAISAAGVTWYHRHDAGENWATLSAPTAALGVALAALCGRAAPRSVVLARPPSGALQRLRSLAGTAMNGRDGRIDPKALELKLLEAAARCLASGQVTENSPAQLRHRQVLARFARYIETSQAEAVPLSEVCAALGVNVRTFRMCCEEAFGMGPIRFLRLRRLQMARNALLNGAGDTVTDVALQYGFTELGRFAGEYARMFGELPSVTLKSAQRQEGSASF